MESNNTKTILTGREVYDLLWAIEGKNHPEGQEFDVDCDEQFVEALMAKGLIAEAAWAIVEVYSETISDGGRIEDFIQGYEVLVNDELNIGEF